MPTGRSSTGSRRSYSRSKSPAAEAVPSNLRAPSGISCELRSWAQSSLNRRQQVLGSLTDAQLQLLEFNTVSGGPEVNGHVTPWWSSAREEQIPPESLWRDKRFWVVLGGRGWGKTRSGAEWVRGNVHEFPGLPGALVAKDPGEARDVMIEGPSGILAVSPSFDTPIYESSKKRLTWPNGTRAGIFSSEEFEELRGPQHAWVWADELPKWRNAQDTWDQIRFGLRVGPRPTACITSTPRPIKTLKQILKDPLTIVTGGTTYENLSNLSAVYLSIVRSFEGTRLGRQELTAQLLDDVPGALWSYSMFEKPGFRLTQIPKDVVAIRAAVALDPSVTEDGNAAGIVAGVRGSDGRAYVIHDRTHQGRPEAWAKTAVDTWRYIEGDHIIAEANQGGLMIEATIKAYDSGVPVRLIHASRGKITRAEPIALLYERGLVSHVGFFPEMEDEMCTYQPADMIGSNVQSPNRMDALVWLLTDLFSFTSADVDKDMVVMDEMISAAGGMNL